jgi:transposase InsO family protein
MKYATITAHQASYPVVLMCRALEVSRSGFYAAQRRAKSDRVKRDEELRTRIPIVHQESRRTYGSPRVHAELQAQGERCGRKRIARLMRQEGLRVKVRRPMRPTTTGSKHTHRVAPNLLDRRFAVTEIEGVNRVWAGDITYVPTREGWLYLAVILDLASR